MASAPALTPRPGATSASPAALALRRLRHDREALGFALLFALLVGALFAAPLYASVVAGTTPAENHLTDQVTSDGERIDVVSLDGIPIGPTWGRAYFLGADENGRDLMVRLLYWGRTSVSIGAGALALTVLVAVPLALVAGYFRGRADSLISRLLDLIWSFRRCWSAFSSPRRSISAALGSARSRSTPARS